MLFRRRIPTLLPRRWSLRALLAVVTLATIYVAWHAHSVTRSPGPALDRPTAADAQPAR